MRLIDEINKVLGRSEKEVTDEVPWPVKAYEEVSDKAPEQAMVRTAMSPECVRIATKLGMEDIDDLVRSKMSVELVDLLVKGGYAFWHTEREKGTGSWFINLRFYNDKAVAKKMKETIDNEKTE